MTLEHFDPPNIPSPTPTNYAAAVSGGQSRRRRRQAGLAALSAATIIAMAALVITLPREGNSPTVSAAPPQPTLQECEGQKMQACSTMTSLAQQRQAHGGNAAIGTLSQRCRQRLHRHAQTGDRFLRRCRQRITDESFRPSPY